jgi:hypothetical protein
MKAITRAGRWVSMIVLAAGSAAAGAQSSMDRSPLWIENQSFGFEACAALRDVPAAEDAQGTLAALRASAMGDVSSAVQIAGVRLSGANSLSMTPVGGRLACGAQPSEVTFHLVAVDSVSGKYWSTDMKVMGDDAATPRANIVALADDMARSFRGVMAQATIR